jgi:Zn-dependent peptidase ImmA (M78 family)
LTRLGAVQAASDALNELELDQSEPIDPFKAIERAGLILRFQPFTGLLGAVLPGRPGGILINSARPAALQRYTAAHELGHWYMDQDVLSVDTDDAVIGDHQHESRELNAQVFAAYFLMPLELLYPTARRYGIKRGTPVEATQVYQAARDMHVSYEATVRHLTNTKFITAGNAAQLHKTSPATAKRHLTHGMGLPTARGDVWVIEHSDNRAEVEAFVGDAILLRLPEHPAGGFRWCDEESLSHATVHPLRPAPQPFDGEQAFPVDVLPASSDIVPFPAPPTSSDVVRLFHDGVMQERYQAGSTPVGGAVTRLVAYAADAPGEESIHLAEIRPSSPDAPNARLEVAALVRDVPAVEFRRRLLAEFARHEMDAGSNGADS